MIIQRYQTNDTWFSERRNAPIFLFIGGEAPANPLWMVKGALFDYAKTYGALCFQLEHRFYGKSLPFKDLSLKSMRYLSSEQALADLANFIQGMNKKYKLARSNKWVLFGGSYPGSLAAWARLKYPHLVHAAVSSSGAIHAKLHMTEYLEVVAESLNTIENGCATAVNEAAKEILKMLHSENGTEIIMNKFKLCSRIDISNTDDLYSFFSNLANIFAYIVQYNKDNRFIQIPTSNVTIEQICLMMTDPSIPNVIDRMASINTMFLKLSKQQCMDFSYSSLIKQYKNISVSSTSYVGDRQWLYQICTELGYMQTSDKPTDLFGPTIPLDWCIKECTDVFGSMFDKKFIESRVERTNRMYGGLHIAATRVVFIFGTIDPWHKLGKVHSATNNTPAIFIKGTAHCADLYPPSENDLPQLTAARREISNYIGKWLMEGIET